MIRRPPRSTQSRSSAASDVYKRQTPQDPQNLAPDFNGSPQPAHTDESDCSPRLDALCRPKASPHAAQNLALSAFTAPKLPHRPAAGPTGADADSRPGPPDPRSL